MTAPSRDLGELVQQWANEGFLEATSALVTMLGATSAQTSPVVVLEGATSTPPVSVPVGPGGAAGAAAGGPHSGAASGGPNAVRIELDGDIQGEIRLIVHDPSGLVAPLGLPDHLVDAAVDEVANVMASHFVVGVSRLGGDSRFAGLGAARLDITPPVRVGADEPLGGRFRGQGPGLALRGVVQAHVDVVVLFWIDEAGVHHLARQGPG